MKSRGIFKDFLYHESIYKFDWSLQQGRILIYRIKDISPLNVCELNNEVQEGMSLLQYEINVNNMLFLADA